jgi:hypothetical protein
MNVGDDLTSDETRLCMMQNIALEAVDECGLAIPAQHSPFVPHVCFAYEDASFVSLLPACIERLGPITFDRVRISIGNDNNDLPLSS